MEAVCTAFGREWELERKLASSPPRSRRTCDPEQHAHLLGQWRSMAAPLLIGSFSLSDCERQTTPRTSWPYLLRGRGAGRGAAGLRGRARRHEAGQLGQTSKARCAPCAGLRAVAAEQWGHGTYPTSIVHKILFLLFCRAVCWLLWAARWVHASESGLTAGGAWAGGSVQPAVA